MPYPFLLKTAAVTLWRSWRATAVLSSMFLPAVAALVFLSALAVAIMKERTAVARQERHRVTAAIFSRKG
jgi:hypothetical protein